ncbi:unnamed protein product [Paramecium sonneborni]|uniref:BTB domain-containing protein n=1 Tax=Paramecium sonneborni TaxID=65129 RepID=A0A8S1K0C4_9CILI|nr:unnamed protein product [Paramecium sonneborni]
MDLIDLGKLSRNNIEDYIQEAFRPQSQVNMTLCIKITYQINQSKPNMPNNQFIMPNNQFNIPNNQFNTPTNKNTPTNSFYRLNSYSNQTFDFFINTTLIQPDIKLQKLQKQQNFQSQYHHVIPQCEDFYINGQNPQNLFKLFLNFIYTGKINYKIKEDYLPLLKLAIYFQCDILIDCLIKQVKHEAIVRNYFLTFIIDIFQDHSYFQVLLSNQNKNAINFFEKMILENAPIILSHTQWHNYNRKEAQEKIQIAFKQVSIKLFKEIAKVFVKFDQKNVIYLTQFLYFVEQYSNPQVDLMEDIYLGIVLQFVDEMFVIKNSQWLTNKCQKIFEHAIKKIENQPYHMMHSKTCDLVNKSFQATCSHQICLNCFYQYLLYRSKFKQQNQNNPQKIRCFRRFIDVDQCNGCFEDSDFLQLKEYQVQDLLNLYLQEKI